MLVLFALLSSPALAVDLRFAVVGDTQATSGERINLDVWPAMAEDINAVSPDLVLFAGDLVNGTYDLDLQIAAWEEWDEVTGVLDAPRYAAAGNHDFFADGAQAAWSETFDWLPRDNSPPGEEGLSYWVDVGDTRFIALLTDAEGGWAVQPNLAWLEDALVDGAGQAHTFVFTHHPISFSAYESIFGGTAGELWQLLLAYDVDALLAGHWHVYQPGLLGGGPPEAGRSGGGSTWELIAGTGGGGQTDLTDRPDNLGYGFALVEIDGARVSVSHYRDEDGDGHYDDVVDNWVLRDAGPPEPALLAWYPLDDGLEDGSDEGPAIPLGLFGDAERTEDGWSGGALELDGDEDYAQAEAINSYEHDLHGDLTLALAARADGLEAGEWANTLAAYGSNDPYTEDETSNYAWWLSMQRDGTLVAFWEFEDGTNVTLTSTEAAAVDAEWHHYTLVRDVDAMAVRFYVDGAQLGDAVSFDRLPTGGQRGLLTLGTDPPPGDATEWAGALDELCLLDRVITEEELARVVAERSCASLAGEVATDTGETGGGDSGPGGEEETGEGGGSGKDEGAGTGCGCGAGPRAAASWWALLVVGWGVGRRVRVYFRPCGLP